MNTVNTFDSNRTSIALSKETYEKLSHFGFAGESFNDLIARLLDLVIKAQQKEVEEEEED